MAFRLGTQTTFGKAYPVDSESLTDVEVSVLPKIKSVTTESVYDLTGPDVSN